MPVLRAGRGFLHGTALAAPDDMLIRYCAAHSVYFGYPRLLGVRWMGWTVSTSGGLCEACRERERERWRPDPYGSVLIPVPVELGPRLLGRRAFGATLAASVAAIVATLALLAVHPPDVVPSGGEPGLFGSGAQLAESPPAQAKVSEFRPVSSGPAETLEATRRAETPRAALTSRNGSVTVLTTRARAPRMVRTVGVGAARFSVDPQSP